LISLTFFLGTELRRRAEAECPERILEPWDKDMTHYSKNPLNDMVRLATFLDARSMAKLLALYRENPSAARFKARLFLTKLRAAFLLEPATYFRVVRISQRGSLIGTARALKDFFGVRIERYLNQFIDR